MCQVPDFRKTMTEEHTKLLSQIFEHLTQGGESLGHDEVVLVVDIHRRYMVHGVKHMLWHIKGSVLFQ